MQIGTLRMEVGVKGYFSIRPLQQVCITRRETLLLGSRDDVPENLPGSPSLLPKADMCHSLPSVHKYQGMLEHLGLCFNFQIY